MRKKIALIEIHQETNSFSPVFTTEEDFKATAYCFNEEVLTTGRAFKKQVDGFLTLVEKKYKDQVTVVPVMAVWAISGGPVQRSLFDKFKQHIIDTLALHPDMDGIYLSLHGAMGVEGIQDPESDILHLLRSLLGSTIPIGLSLDLHANLTREMVEMATFITGYRTNPHRDHFEVGYKTGRILIETVLGNIKPVMAFRKMRLLKGGGFTIDFLSPMRPIFRRMKQMEQLPGVLSVTNFMVHIWLDDPELGWSTVAVTDANASLAEQLADELADLNWAVRDIPHPQPVLPQQAIALAQQSWLRRKMGTTIFCDVSDIVAAGAPGENTWLLKTIMEQAPTLIAYVPVRDKEMAQLTYQMPLNEEVTLWVGGKLETQYNQPYLFTGRIISKHSFKETGKTVVLKHQGTYLILTERPAFIFYPKFYHDLGLSLWKADIAVVKNLFPFRYFFLPYNRKTINVISAGTTNIDVFQLNYQHIPRPIYPLDPIETWR